MRIETLDHRNQNFLDLFDSGEIEIKIKSDGKVIWVNTERHGCVLRICRIEGKITVVDERRWRERCL